MTSNLTEMGKRAKTAARQAAKLSTNEKNRILHIVADALEANTAELLAANAPDVANAANDGKNAAFIDRLTLTEARIASMARDMRNVATLDDPVNEVTEMKTLQSGLSVGKKRVPLGVIGIIYESRPNVTADAFGLCFKAGNSVILRGGKEAILTNTSIVNACRNALAANGLTPDFIQLIEDTSRESANALMNLTDYLDVLIPRGGGGLIKAVVENSRVPVIETGTGNCHIFVDESADLTNATAIILNAKTQRPGVCNACERVLIHRAIAPAYLPVLVEALRAADVEVRGDRAAADMCADITYAPDGDEWYKEYLDFIIGIAIVDGLDAAVAHIDKYSTGHSEAILTESYANAQAFLQEVDSAAVYVNASTRFTDGSEFGLGAEIGISTQKLHARGPMGLKELTSYKYIVYGNGQVRG